MSIFKNLKNTIAANIKDNGVGEITGTVLQEQLINIINELGSGMQFIGVATPTTNPGAPEAPCFYIATKGGQYTNFLNSENTYLTLEKDSIYILQFNNEYWESQNIAENISGGSASPELEIKVKEIEAKVDDLIAQQLIDKYAYGIIIKGTNVTRIGNMQLHKDLPVQKLIGVTLLQDDGTNLIQEMGAKAFSEALIGADIGDTEGSFDELLSIPFDGSYGQVMVYIPDFYIMHRSATDDITGMECDEILISKREIPGFTYIPEFYVGAYEATLNRDTNTLSSVKSSDPAYRGGDNTADWDGTYRSLLGKPASNLPEKNLRDLVRKRDASSYNWNIMTYDCQKILFWLFAIEYATLDAQASYIKELTAEGYHQGGLGGVNTLNGPTWKSYNNYNPILPIGYTDKLNYQSGEVRYDIPKESGTLGTVSATRYRGIENPFGHLYKQIDGILCQPAGNFSYVPYIFKSRESYSDNNDNMDNIYSPGMIKCKDGNGTSGWLNGIIFGSRLDILPYVKNTEYPDWVELFIQKIAPIYMGGALFSSSQAGFLNVRMGEGSMNSRNYAGTRICYIPSDINWNWED